MSNTLKHLALVVFGCAFGASFIRYMQHGTFSDVTVVAIVTGFIAFILYKDFDKAYKATQEELNKQLTTILLLSDSVKELEKKVSELRTAKTLSTLSQTYPGAGGYTLKR